ncbi:MAG: hypothetical protein HUJ26_22975 [Planctomycetaceae bacterium]|nr:hypothetical protein [Planctomycetaceae bacterium]
MPASRFTLLTLAFSWVLLILPGAHSNVSAQEEAPPSSNSEEQKSREAPSIFIPYEKLEEVFGKKGASAILPYADLQKLMKLLEDHRPQLPQAVLTKSSYQVSVEQEVARIQTELSLRSTGAGWTSLRLPFKGASVGQATLDNEEAFFRGAGDGAYLVQLPAKGDYQLTLELLVPVQASPDQKVISFQTPLAGITTAEVTVPSADQTISVKPESIVTPMASDGELTKARVNLGATDHIEISWTPKASTKPKMELLTSVQNQTLVTLADGLVHTEALLDIDVLRGELSELQVLVPKSHRILGVSSPTVNVQRQTVEETEEAKIITITLLQAISKSFRLEVHSEQAMPEGNFPLAGTNEDGEVFGIHVRGAIRESGTLSIAHAQGTRLIVEQQEGLIRVDGPSVPEAVRNRAQVHFKFYSPVFTLIGGIQPVQPRIQVQHQTQHVFEKNALVLNSQLFYQIERAGVFDLQIKLPSELTIESVTAENLREYTIDDATGTMTVSFHEKRLGAVQIRLKGRIDLEEADENELQLPVPEPLEVFQETGTISVYAPPSLEIDTVEEETNGVIPVDAGNPQNGRNRLIASWSYQSRPMAVTVRTVRKPTRLSARVETYLEVNEDQAAGQTRVLYEVEHAPVRVFQIDIPESLKDLVTIEVPAKGGQSIQSQTPAEEAVDGWVTWTIELTQDALGQQTFNVNYDIPLEREGDEQLSDVEILLPKAMPALTDVEDGAEISLVRTVGEIGIARDRALAISSELQSDRSETLDPRELSMEARASDQAYRYFTQPVTLSIRSRKYEIESVVETVISRALVEIAIGYDPQATYRCRYLINTSERQRLLVQLPVNADPLSVLVDGQRVDLEQAEEDESTDEYDAYYVNISRADVSQQELTLTIQFLWPINPPQFKGPLGTLQLGFPQIGSQGGAAAVQQCRLAIWVPDKFHLVGTPSRFNDDQTTQISAALFGFPTSQAVSPEDLNQWINEVPTGAIEFPTEGIGYSFQSMGNIESTRVAWWEMHYMVWVLSGALLAIGWLLKNTSWENRLGVVLLLVFLASIYAVKDDDTIAHILAAARFGIFAVAVLWGIQTCCGTDWLTKLRRSPSSASEEEANLSDSENLSPEKEAAEEPSDEPPDPEQEKDS